MREAIIGCGVLGLVVVALVTQGCCGACEQAGEGGASGKPKKKRKAAAEVITYGAVKDHKSGPSDVKPSGRSGATLKTRGGVVEAGSDEGISRSSMGLGKVPECPAEANVGDVFKGVVLELDREARDQAPLSIAEQVKLGDALAAQVREHKDFKGKVDTAATAKWRAYLARVAQPLLAEVKNKKLTYHFHVIDAPVANAFAIPGGHIYFYTGLLENRGGTWLANEAQLAGILAHEISHIDLGHVVAVYQYLKRLGVAGTEGEQIATVAVALARHPFSSAQEDEADKNAVRMMTLAQYAPAEFALMWESWAKAEKRRGKPKGEGGGDPILKELEGLLRSHSTAEQRACHGWVHAAEEVEKLRFDRYYVGGENFKKRRSRVQEQY